MTCTLYLVVSSSLLSDSVSGTAVPRSVCSLVSLVFLLPCLLLTDLRPVSTLSLLCSLAHILIRWLKRSSYDCSDISWLVSVIWNQDDEVVFLICSPFHSFDHYASSAGLAVDSHLQHTAVAACLICVHQLSQIMELDLKALHDPSDLSILWLFSDVQIISSKFIIEYPIFLLWAYKKSLVFTFIQKINNQLTKFE